jgi:hypothetical protein
LHCSIHVGLVLLKGGPSPYAFITRILSRAALLSCHTAAPG